MKIIVPRTPALDFEFPSDVEVVTISESEEVPAEHRDAEVAVVWGMRGAIESFVTQLPNVRWFQTLSAGPDALLRANLREDVIITNGIHLHDRPVAEHALGLALALARQIPECIEAQHRHEWSRELAKPHPLHEDTRVTTVVGSKVVVWGFGAIGQQIGRVFAACGSDVIGVAQSSGERAGFPVRSSSEILEVVHDCDILVMVLPNTDTTVDALNASVLEALPSRALIVNVGRGTTVDENALIKALRNRQISAAAIDVVKDEPLPADSPLWDTPNLLITPHSAGGRPDGFKDLMLHNLTAYREDRISDMQGLKRVPQA
ncbi:MAG: NAD(P)-dependent oxidoreductase [Actinomycetaceae bacterium]|nr:NAD(P)-dependent oxidoreductase [Actinomycetaceae bacterium]